MTKQKFTIYYSLIFLCVAALIYYFSNKSMDEEGDRIFEKYSPISVDDTILSRVVHIKDMKETVLSASPVTIYLTLEDEISKRIFVDAHNEKFDINKLISIGDSLLKFKDSSRIHIKKKNENFEKTYTLSLNY